MIRRRALSWFATLRRDGRLFALMASLALMTAMLQPWAEARAAGSPLSWTICATYGVAKAEGAVPGAADDCPMCVAGHPCAGMTPPPATGLPSAGLAWPAVRDIAGDAPFHRPRPDPDSSPSDPPPAIRAPPLSA